MADAALSPTVTTSTKALHTWSLFRTLDRYVAPGSMPSGGLPEQLVASTGEGRTGRSW